MKQLLAINIFDRYIGRNILAMVIVTLLLLLGISAIIKFVEEFRNVGQGDYSADKAFLFVLLSLPRELENFFVPSVLLGSLIALGNLASNSEIIAMQSLGKSKASIGLSAMKTAIPLMILVMLLSEFIVPNSEQFAREFKATAQSKGRILATKQGLWLKDKNDFVYVKSVNNVNELQGVIIYQIRNNQLTKQISANSAQFSDKQWQLFDVQITNLANNQIKYNHLPKMNWQTELTPNKFSILFKRADSLSISGLFEYIKFLKQSNLDAKPFEIVFWRKVYQPIALVVMILLALSFIFGSLRQSSMGSKIVIGVLSGFAFYVLNVIFGNLSVLVDFIPVYLLALVPSLATFAITWFLLNKK